MLRRQSTKRSGCGGLVGRYFLCSVLTNFLSKVAFDRGLAEVMRRLLLGACPSAETARSLSVVVMVAPWFVLIGGDEPTP